MAIDPRFLADSGREIFTGNELLVKGCLETDGGVHLLTGYPGSPVAGFFDVLGDISSLLQKNGVRAFQANNEALSVAAVNGSQMMGARAITAFKSVGVHVASDALAIGNLAGCHPDGGAVIVCGEDPWCESTQVPADSRFLCEHLRMPVVEPGGPQQLKDWIDCCFKLSNVGGLYIAYIVTVAQADGGGTVNVKPNQFPKENTNNKFEMETAKISLERVLLPPRTWKRELVIGDRYVATMNKARELGVNKIIPARNGRNEKAALGFVVTGMGGPYLQHVLADLGLHEQFPILQMGMSYPADVNLVAEFAQTCDKMIVIEERRSFLEKNIRDTVFQTLAHDVAADLAGRLYGKKFPGDKSGIPDTRGLNASVLTQILIPLIKATESIPPELRNGRLTAEMAIINKASRPKLEVLASVDEIVPRTPTFCPGCPHRDSSSVLLELRKNFADAEYMKKHHNRGPVDMLAHGDTGCYTMLMFAPTEQLMHNYSGMGLGGGTGSGIDSFITNKQIVFMGDGTFFHSGQIAISHAIKNGQDICFIILENGTTAMTGHQEHPGTEIDVLGNNTWLQDIEAVCRGMQGTSPLTVEKLSPADRTAYKAMLEKTILADGVKVLIADKECGITANRTVLKAERNTIKKHGYLPKKTHMNVTPEVCENCLECTKATACPGLTSIDTDYGKKIDTDLTWCVNDGACERVRVSNELEESVKPCPSFEQITVVRQKRRRYTLPHMALDKLPDPTWVHDMTTAGNPWRCHMAGVGGMGIGVVNAILVRAGHKEGYRVIFSDKKGLAIRNGGVYSQITFISEAATGPAPDDHSAEHERDAKSMDAAEDVNGASDPRNNHHTNASFDHLSSEHPSFEAPQATLPNHSPTTGSIPYGRADLLLGIDILEACRATDPREQFRVASSEFTCSVLNMPKQPTVFGLLGRSDFDPEKLRQEVFAHSRVEHSFAKNLSELCEQRLGSKLYANIMMLGVAYQLGLIPVSAHSIAWAIKDSIRRDHRKNLKAFNIGRKLALEPRAIPNRPVPETWEQLVTNKVRIIRKSKMRGRTLAMDFERLVQGAMKQLRDLPEEAKYDVAIRIYDLLMYQDLALAKRYVELVRSVLKQDSATRQYAATQAALWGIAKVMLIKDEPYVAYLLTRYEKKVRDIAKFGVDESNGDKIVYRHHTSPEFNIGKFRIRMKLTTTDWQLKLVAGMKWWRKLPGWHKKENAFRDWYIGLLDRVNLSTEEGYAQAIKVFKCHEDVTGYREIRYPKMDATRAAIEQELLPMAPEAQGRTSIFDASRTPTHV
ncbi:indolepyruvate ferredoxin oxidoreductase family protein [soil metagenome]